jgi:alkylhydroperoxidase family enzyme
MLINPVAQDPDRAQAFADGQAAGWGYVPNYAAVLGVRPAVADAWLQLSAAVRDGMDRRRYEVAVIGAARALRSTYCTAAHSKFLRDDCGDEPAMVATATGEGLSDEDRAVMDFAALVAGDAASITEDDVEGMRRRGFSDDDLADIVFAAAARAFFTKALDGFGVAPDHQLGAQFPPELRAAMVVGRPMPESP